ncbi:MAG: hypothetical protein AAF434_07905 [Pseudomonadota bacterium]
MKNLTHMLRPLSITLTCLGLVACGGGGGGSDDGNDSTGSSGSSGGVSNSAPVITSSDNASVAENTSDVIYTLTATDAQNDAITFEIESTGMHDEALMSLDSATGALRFINPPDFETPLDQNNDNVYEVTLSAVDSKGERSESILLSVAVTDTSQLQFRNDFPTPNANLGGVDNTTITVTIIDAEDGVVSETDLQQIESVRFTTFSSPGTPELLPAGSGGIVKFSASLGIAASSETIFIAAEDAEGEVFSKQFSVVNRTTISSAADIAFDSTNDRILLVDPQQTLAFTLSSLPNTSGELSVTLISGSVVGEGVSLIEPTAIASEFGSPVIVDAGLDGGVFVDSSTGNRTEILGLGGLTNMRDIATAQTITGQYTVLDVDQNALIFTSGFSRAVVSGSNFPGSIPAVVGSGNNFVTPVAAVLDEANDLAYVLDIQGTFTVAVTRVDTNTGDRTLLADVYQAGDASTAYTDLVLDNANSRLLIAAPRAILAVSTSDGSVTTLSENTSAFSGPELESPGSVIVDSGRNRVFVADANRVLAINGSTGNRQQQFTFGSIGDGSPMNSLTAIALDADGQRAFIADANFNATAPLVAVDLTNGNRTRIANSADPAPRNFGDIPGILVDAANNRAFVLDNETLLTMDLTSGALSALAVGNPVTPDTTIFGARDLAMDKANDRVLVLTDRSLIEVRLSDGAQFLVSGNADGLARPFDDPQALALSESNGKLFAYVIESGITIVRVDLDTGVRDTFMDTAGVFDPAAQALAFEMADNEIAYMVLGENENTVLARFQEGDVLPIDVSVFGVLGDGPDFRGVSDMVIDTDNDHALVSANATGAVFIVDLTTGDRAIVTQ